MNATVNASDRDRGAHESSLGAQESSLKTSGAHESSLKTSNTGAQESCLLCEECTEDPDDSPREAIQLANGRLTIKDQVHLHLQKKLVGYILQRIHLVQDFIKTYCYEDHRGFLTEKRKHMVQKLNQALEPWVRILGKITTHTRLNQLSEWSYKQNSQGEFTVYARVNLLSPSDLYIGETQNLKIRTIQHWTATCKHRIDCPNKCKGCKPADHKKYLKHRSAAPHQWITIPLVYLKSKKEAQQLEKRIIKILKPNLNESDKPFWLLKDTYASLYKLEARRRPPGNNPWTKSTGLPRTQINQNPIPVITTYEFNDQLYMNLKPIIEEMVSTETNGIIKINPGRRDITNWSKIRYKYGDSKINIKGELKGTLHTWRTPATMCEIYLRPKVTQTIRDPKIWEIFKDLDEFKHQIKEASEEDMKFYWETRNVIEKSKRFKVRKIIWDTCVKRYNCPRSPIEIRIPFSKFIQARKIRNKLHEIVEQQKDWPPFIKAWHIKHLRIITENPQSIGDILINVNKPWNTCNTCICKQVYGNLNKKKYFDSLTEIDGHIFGISRDYKGPNKQALEVGANNVPKQTNWDLQRAWDKAFNALPGTVKIDKKTWDTTLTQCKSPYGNLAKEPQFVNTKTVYTLRKDFQGLVIGEVDKNPHELWYCCPILYNKAWEQSYNEKTGYKRITPQQLNKKWKHDTLAYQLTEETDIDKEVQETEIIKHWQKTYKYNQWDKIATFNPKGGFNKPYILFKGKNITDHNTRKDKWKKARPIAPQTKHPMRKLFHLTGRAWSFITNNIPGDHFVLKKADDVPAFLEEVQHDLGNRGKIKSTIQDIEGCFPNMSKNIIQIGLLSIINKIKAEHSYTGVFVPKRGKAPVTWNTKRKDYIKLSFDILYDVMLFALHNTLIKDQNNKLWKQVEGIPMGDPHSPGMTIGACAWMEADWLKTISDQTKLQFKARRYMDDILLFYTNNSNFNSTELLGNFKKECYLPPLNLEEANESTFLETTFMVNKKNKIRYWLKNQNIPGQQPKIWRYAHFHSSMAYPQKSAILLACLKKLQKMASDNTALKDSAIQKLHEFLNLQYPKKLIWSMCTTMGVQTRNKVWFNIRDSM